MRRVLTKAGLPDELFSPDAPDTRFAEPVFKSLGARSIGRSRLRCLKAKNSCINQINLSAMSSNNDSIWFMTAARSNTFSISPPLPGPISCSLENRRQFTNDFGEGNRRAQLCGAFVSQVSGDGSGQSICLFPAGPVPHAGRDASGAHTAGLLGAAWFDCLRVQRLIRRANLDVFHGPSHFLPLRKFAGIKYVVTVHDLAFRVMPEQYDWKHRWYFGWQLARSLKMADAIAADSHNTKKDIIRFYGIPEERIPGGPAWGGGAVPPCRRIAR